MKNLKLIIALLLLTQLNFGQERLVDGVVKNNIQNNFIIIHVKDACQQKNINNAKVTLEAYNKQPIIAKYSKEKKYYYFENPPNDYTTIFVSHNKFETEGYRKDKSFPQKINLQLNCKGNIRETRTEELVSSEVKSGVNYAVYKIDTIFTGRVVVRDNYKVKISIKKSYNLSYNEIKRKIDSLVVPYGLEYIDNLVPEIFFAHFSSWIVNGNSEQSFPLKSLEKTKSMTNLLTDKESFLSSYNKYGDFVIDSPYSFWDDQYFQLLYRKKDKTTFRGDFDLLLKEISERNPSLKLSLLYYNKFLINHDYPLKISCKNLSKYDDEIMNYQFFEDYDNDPSRVLFMDKYFESTNTYLGKYELDKSIDGEVEYYPKPFQDRSNFNYVLELSKNK